MQAIIARREAVEQLQRLLQTNDDLNKLQPLLQEYKSQQQVAKDHLRVALASNVERLRAGLESLVKAQQALARFETSFSTIDALCTECGSLVDCHADVRRLASVHSNLRHTLHSCEAVANLPQQAADAEKLLKDRSSGLLHAYACVAELEATAVRVQEALEAVNSQTGGGGGLGGQGRSAQLPSLGSYFSQVHQAMAKVEERVWSTLRQFRTLASRDPAQLVTALQVVEVQEGVDAQLLAAGQGGSKLRKGWRRRCMAQLSASIQESFAPLLQRCSKIMAADAQAQEILKEVLADAGAQVQELARLRDALVPCFPPHFGALEYISAEYQAQVDNLIDLVGLAAGQLSNGDILQVMCWVAEYQATLAKVRNRKEIEKGAYNNANDNEGPSTGAALLMDTYVDRVSGTLESWLANIVESDFAGEPRVTAEGRLWTPGPVDLFRILDEQLAVASKAGGALLARVAGEAALTLRSFQQACRARLERGQLPLEILCAAANNSHRCAALGEEFATTAAAQLQGQQQHEEGDDIRDACRAFPELGDGAVARCVEVVFSDPGFGELFSRVACTDAWVAGTVTGSVLATLDDFFQDFERWLQRPLYLRLVELAMAECATHFLAAALTQLRTLRNEDLRALRRDVSKVTSFFSGMLGQEEATAACQPLADVCEFVNSDSVEAFVLSYTSLLESAPGITPVLISNLLAARVASHEDMTKADAKEVLEGCREVYAAGQARLASVSVPSPLFTASKGRGIITVGRDAAFLAAVNAARRRAPYTTWK